VGRTRHRFDDPHELRRTQQPVEVAQPRREIGDLHLGAIVGRQQGDDGGGIALILRSRGDLAIQHHIAKAFFLVARDQPAEHRIAVEAGKTPPHQLAPAVDQGGDAAIADNGKIDRPRHDTMLIARLPQPS
jgi:hypothetical protein